MKLPPQRVSAFLKDPGACRVVLLHGEDHGMIRDRAAALVRAVAGSLDDPFLVAELGRDEVARLADEAASLALTGGRRVVRLREATDAAVGPVTAVLKGPAPAPAPAKHAYHPPDGIEVLEDPGHPYSAGLLGAVPTRQTPRGGLHAIPGQPPAAGEQVVGCAFTPRCSFAIDSCRERVPDLATVGPDHRAACPVVGGKVPVALAATRGES